MSDHGGYNLQAGRNAEQIDEMKRLQAEGKCFMCYENLSAHKHNRIIFETKHWSVTPNGFPYKHTSLHLLLVPRRHVATISELTPEERADMMEAVVECEKRWKLDSYSLGMRSGDFRFNGGSVEHIHAHIMVGERDAKKFEKVRFKVSSHPDVD